MKPIALLLTALLCVGVAVASPETLALGKSIVDAQTPCSALSTEQLEAVGEYLMEQMHPGEAHEYMHQMMGLQEGSQAEEQFHVALAQRHYCGAWSANTTIVPYGMMGRGGRTMAYSSGMMGSGYGMMGGSYSVWLWINNVLFTALLIALILFVLTLIQHFAKKKR